LPWVFAGGKYAVYCGVGGRDAAVLGKYAKEVSAAKEEVDEEDMADMVL
jgi:hypothetical protein